MSVNNHKSPDGSIYYFGYGALVNPVSRQRRGVKTCQAQAASLPDYKLTFAEGGAANICRAQGWECHGILMKCASEQDFEVLKAFDAGYDCIQVEVYPYHGYWEEETPSGNSKDHTCCGYRNCLQGKDPIKANVFVMNADESLNQERPQERLPQERYLRVIASGMQSYGVDEGYIQEQILGVPYIPSRKPKEYLRFPPQSNHLPTLTLQEWDLHCALLMERASMAGKNLLLVRIGSTVIQVQDYDANNPFCQWAQERIRGPDDATWVLLQTLFDPDLKPFITHPTQVTQVHQDWAENQLVEKFEQAGLHNAVAILHVQNLEQEEEEDQRIELSTRSSAELTATTSTTEGSMVSPASSTRRMSRGRSHKIMGRSLRSSLRRVFSLRALRRSSRSTGKL